MRNSTKRIFSRSLSGFLAFLMIFGVLVSLSLVPVMAADNSSSDSTVTLEDWVKKFYTDPNYNSDDMPGGSPNPDFTTEDNRVAAMGDARYDNDYYEIFADPITGEVAVRDKITGDYLFSNPFDIAEVALTRPLGSERNVTEDWKIRLLSQVEIKYTDITTTTSGGLTYNSFKDSALLGQIAIKRLKGGIRIEYSIGLEESRTLVPRVFSLDRYNWMCEQFRTNLGLDESTDPYSRASFIFRQFQGFYKTYEMSDYMVKYPDKIEGVTKKYPIFEQMDIAVFSEDAKAREIRQIENYIKSYCPEYTFEDLDNDHRETGYENTDKMPANFRMALEYYLTNNGVEVRFPANGLTFDESGYSLTQIDILKYMGAGSLDYNGYTFIPDGSGTLIRYEDVTEPFERIGKVYGEDYAYQEVANANQEIYRMPVFGVVTSNTQRSDLSLVYGYTPVYEYGTDEKIKTYSVPDMVEGEYPEVLIEVNRYDALGKLTHTEGVSVKGEREIQIPVYEYEREVSGALKVDKDGNYIPVLDENGNHKVREYITQVIKKDAPKIVNYIPIYKATKTSASGYFAIVTEGDALTTITSTHGADKKDHYFNSVYCTFKPRPKDSYNLQDAISVGSNTSYTVVSERKYTGSFKINYIMLTDPAKMVEAQNAAPGRKLYETSYVGMANAYRDYLSGKGYISPLTDTKEDIPLFIESFGKTEDDDTFLSIPITVDVALTSFSDLKKMVTYLKDNKITNINFRLTGFTNGGMVPTVPTSVEFEDVVGGDDGFNSFLKYAAEQGVEVYPEFDFAYMHDTALFDGFDYDDHAVKTIDNRYITKREYDAVLQTFTTSGKICISPSVYSEFFEGFDESMKDIIGKKTTNISAGTLGSDLNSDFDEDEPYNREDSKNFTVEMLKLIQGSKTYGKIMVDAGNSYTIPYADVVLNAPLDSSRYLNTSESVPFFGMVYHGYLVYAGKPTNMAGDMQYEKLKIIENGATLYMMLSYDNVEILKEDEYLSKYYAISFEHWRETLVSKYDENGTLVSLGLYDELNIALKDVQKSTITYHAYINCLRRFSNAESENIYSIAKANWTAKRDAALAAKNKATASLAMYDRIVAELEGDEAKMILRTMGYFGNEVLAEISRREDALATQVRQLTASIDDLEKRLASMEAAGLDGEAVKAQITELTATLAEVNVAYGEARDEAGAFSNCLSSYNSYVKTNTVADYDKVKLLYGTFVVDTLTEIKEAAEAEYANYALVIEEGSTESAALANNEAFKAEVASLEVEYYDNRVINDGSVVFVQYTSAEGAIKYFVINYNDYVVDVDTVINGIHVQTDVEANNYKFFYVENA